MQGAYDLISIGRYRGYGGKCGRIAATRSATRTAGMPGMLTGFRKAPARRSLEAFTGHGQQGRRPSKRKLAAPGISAHDNAGRRGTGPEKFGAGAGSERQVLSWQPARRRNPGAGRAPPIWHRGAGARRAGGQGGADGHSRPLRRMWAPPRKMAGGASSPVIGPASRSRRDSWRFTQ